MAASGYEFHSDNPIVQRLLAGTAPTPIRVAAARGALPITPEELLHVLYGLSADPDPEVQKAIPATLQGLADEALAGLLARELPPALLGFVARQVTDKPKTLEALVLNRGTGDDTLAWVASFAPADVIELLVTNQVALIRSPAILETLLGNPALSIDQRRRLQEVHEEFFVKRERAEQRRRDEEERLAKLRLKKDWSLQELEKLTDDLVAEAQADKEAGRLFEDDDERVAEGEEAQLNATQRLLKMSVPEKILMALRGSRTERSLLIRDSNRLVAVACIRSPKVTEADVEFIAGLRNVNEEILRIISQRREWLKAYSVVHTLVKNPRTPIAISMNLLSRLQAADLKKLLTDRNIAETVRRQAKNQMEKAAQRH